MVFFLKVTIKKRDDTVTRPERGHGRWQMTAFMVAILGLLFLFIPQPWSGLDIVGANTHLASSRNEKKSLIQNPGNRIYVTGKTVHI